jgi:hypothetical protein
VNNASGFEGKLLRYLSLCPSNLDHGYVPWQNQAHAQEAAA